MANGSFLGHFLRGMMAEALADRTDAELVEMACADRSEAAFEAILCRHGPMVYRVCWRILQQEQDVEDAFQAIFLILAHKLQTLRRRASLACWLQGIARRVALKAKAQAISRQRRDQECFQPPPKDALEDELSAALDAELTNLPDKWRAPLVLCYLEGRTQEEAAKQLGLSARTLRRRLEEARAALGRRLMGRGIVLTGAMFVVLCADGSAWTALPAELVDITVQAAGCIMTGQAAKTSAKVAALTEGMLRTMLITKLKLALAVIGGLALMLGAGTLLSQAWAWNLATPMDPEPLPLRAPENRLAENAVEHQEWIAWGKPIDGLRAGLAFTGAPRKYRDGDKAELVVRLHNVSARPLTFSYGHPMFAAGGNPVVKDAKGATIPLELPAVDMPVELLHVTLKPGESLTLGEPSFFVRTTERRDELTHGVLTAAAGRYQVSQRIELIAHVKGGWAGELVTGELPLEIVLALPQKQAEINIGAPKGKPGKDPKPDPRAALKKDHASLQGRWILVEGEFGDRKFKGDAKIPVIYTFRGDRCEMQYGGGSPNPAGGIDGPMKAIFKLSPGDKARKIDFDFDPKTVLNGPPLSIDTGIYRIQDDMLWLCLCSTVGPQPMAFRAPDGTNQVLYVFKRMPQK